MVCRDSGLVMLSVGKDGMLGELLHIAGGGLS